MDVRTYDILMLLALIAIVVILFMQKRENEKLHDQIFELMYALGVIASKKGEGTVVQIKKGPFNGKANIGNHNQEL